MSKLNNSKEKNGSKDLFRSTLSISLNAQKAFSWDLISTWFRRPWKSMPSVSSLTHALSTKRKGSNSWRKMISKDMWTSWTSNWMLRLGSTKELLTTWSLSARLEIRHSFSPSWSTAKIFRASEMPLPIPYLVHSQLKEPSHRIRWKKVSGPLLIKHWPEWTKETSKIWTQFSKETSSWFCSTLS